MTGAFVMTRARAMGGIVWALRAESATPCAQAFLGARLVDATRTTVANAGAPRRMKVPTIGCMRGIEGRPDRALIGSDRPPICHRSAHRASSSPARPQAPSAGRNEVSFRAEARNDSRASVSHRWLADGRPDQRERGVGLPAVLRTEPVQYHVPAAALHVHHRGLSIELPGAEEPAGEQRVAAGRV